MAGGWICSRLRSFDTAWLGPELLRQEIGAAASALRQQIVIDEIQKLPALLDEVQWLIENRGLRFALCGSSARRLKRGAANLLAGRALRSELHGVSPGELGSELDMDCMLNHGCLRQSPEVIDGNTPHTQRGCGAQAWGVTELYRVVKTLKS